MRNLLLLICALAVIGSTSCRRILFDSGALVIEERDVDDFYDALTLEGSMNVYIVQDSTFDIRVEAGERKLPYIETRVFNDELVVSESPNNIICDKQTKVFVSTDFLQSISIHGSGDIEGSGILAENLSMDIRGSGDMDLGVEVVEQVEIDIKGSGNCKIDGDAYSGVIRVDGSGDVDARYLDLTEAFVFIDASGDVRITVSSFIHAEIDGSGDLYYWGNPETTEFEIYGSGDIISME